MTDLDSTVAAVRRDIATAQAARAAADHKYQVAMAQALAAARDLKDEFGVTSVLDARQLLARLEEELAAECTTVRQALARSGQGEAVDSD